MGDRLRRVAQGSFGAPPPRSRVTADYIKAELKAHPPNEALLDHLFTFGELMLGEVSERSSTLDSKADSILGWTSGLLAFFIWQSAPAQPSVLVSVVVVTGAFGAAVALIASAIALRIRQWNWPSQHDWFRTELFPHLSVLKTYHVICMLETHDGHCEVNARKARALKIAQVGMVVAGACLVAQLLLGVALRWI